MPSPSINLPDKTYEDTRIYRYNDVMSVTQPTPIAHILPETQVREQRIRYEHLLADLGAPSLEATKAFLAEREVAEPEEGLTEALRERIEAKIAAATHPNNQ